MPLTLAFTAQAGAASSKAVCQPSFSAAHCMARVVTDVHGNVLNVAAQIDSQAAGTPPFKPSDIHTGYNLPNTGSGTPTIAIVDAFDDPNAEADLGTFDAMFGLPACTTANGCFRKVNQNGGTAPPPSDVGWSVEISLDIQWAHAICQNCHILLVEANDNSFTNLGAAVNRAAAMGANIISNSYGGTEFGGSISAYNHPFTVITASTGDNGFAAGTQFPASAPTVVAVGGTSLHLNSSGGYVSESAWNGAGSGCSSFYSSKRFMRASQTATCGTRRGEADVSAVADPNTGVGVYDSFGEPGLIQLGGTSVSAPLIAGVYGLANNFSATKYPGQLPYKHASSLHDITSGNNGSCGGNRICTAMGGWDGPTGLGSPNGVGAF
jgi:subtilase family serine protease